MYLRSSTPRSRMTRVLRGLGVSVGVIAAMLLLRALGFTAHTRDIGSRVLVLLTRPADIVAEWWRAANMGDRAQHFSERNSSAKIVVGDTNTTATIDALQARIAELEVVAASVRDTTRERDELRTMMHMALQRPPIAVARVIGHDLTTPYKVITIDRGSDDGVRAGQAVSSAAGLVGHVLRAGATQAIVVLLTDPTHAVDVIDERSRERGVLLGNGDGLALGRQVGVTRLEYVNGAADIAVGDVLITSGLDNRYPPGFPVGTIRAVRTRADGLFDTADVTPLIDWTNVELVSVWPTRTE